jgi:hypothetical protein
LGEKQNRPFQLSFNASLKAEFQRSRVTSDGDLILVRELDECLDFGDLIAQHLTDDRGENTQLPLADLRQSVYSRIAGYEDVNEAERLAPDPTFRLIGSEKIWERGAALTSRLQYFETEVLAQEENLAGLAAINRSLIAKAEAIDSSQRVVLDMNSTEIPVYGQQDGDASQMSLKMNCFPAFVPGQNAGMAIRELPDVLGMKNPKKSGIGEAVAGRMTLNWNAKMEIPVHAVSRYQRKDCIDARVREGPTTVSEPRFWQAHCFRQVAGSRATKESSLNASLGYVIENEHDSPCSRGRGI